MMYNISNLTASGGEILLDILRKYKRVLFFLMFLPICLLYFLISYIDFERTMIHCALDDIIPFVPAFIVPYVLWYAYVPLMLILTCFAAPEYFVRQCAAFFGGALFCLLTFIVFPTAIDFRPQITGGGVFEWMCGVTFANDKPVNVFPSLHCYEALAVHLTTFSVPGLHRKTALRSASAVLAAIICASTVFVKQHSVIDVFAGCTVAVLAALPVLILNRRSRKNDNQAV